MSRELVLVLDFGGQYNQLIARRVRECNVYCEVHPYNLSVEKIREMNPKGIIFTGGPNSVYGENSPLCDKSYWPSGPNIASTSSPSFFLSKPWSTNTQVNCFPIAFDNKTAATDESTPPDNAHKALPFPTFSLISSIVFSTNESIFQSPEHLQML